jgi:hypothetical protein
MLIAINADNIHIGDVIRTTSGISGKVIGRRGFRVEKNKLEFRLDCMGDEPVYLGTLEIVELCHRPWPEGKSSRDMLGEIESLAVQVSNQISHPLNGELFGELHEALDAYRLGKPEQETRPRKPVRSSADLTRDWLDS